MAAALKASLYAVRAYKFPSATIFSRLDVECLIGDDLLQATVLIFELFNYARLSRRIPPPRARPRAAHDVNTERSRNVQCTTTRGLDGFSRELACPPPNTRAGA